ncbi:DUF4081 domain-containing protein [Nesterenkonia pannonica]|uniref:DUF4081 domain-containing protein n=1 Tax=Nesterenkonia pannonica TaxID=1548602 RepID=UPI00216417B3|nr:DUF4081 domain-containing protein [Nesterenkonia pannonica]
MPLWSPSADPQAKIARATDGAVRILRPEDTSALLRLLDQDPVGNVSAAAAVRQRGSAGPSSNRMGAMLLGIDDAEGGLRAACWLGSNIIPIGADAAVVRLFGQAAASLRRRVSSIYSHADAVLALFKATGWSHEQEIRADQPLMAISGPPRWSRCARCAPHGSKSSVQWRRPARRCSPKSWASAPTPKASPSTANGSGAHPVRALADRRGSSVPQHRLQGGVRCCD